LWPIATYCVATRSRSLEAQSRHGFSRITPPGLWVHGLGENITTRRLQLDRLPLGALLRLGPSAVVELTGLRTPCVLLDRFQAGLKKRMLNGDGPRYKCGVMGIVRAGGPLHAGDKQLRVSAAGRSGAVACSVTRLA
jgi:MOSC domain-containing protein YiiM